MKDNHQGHLYQSASKPILLVEAEAIDQYSVAKEIEEKKQIFELKQILSEAQSESATFKKENGMGISSVVIPQVSGSSSCISWYQTPLSSLHTLLEKARNKQTCKHISPNDLEYIIQCCDYQGYFSAWEYRKLAKTAIRILNYIALHQLHLPVTAITALRKELAKKDNKTLNYALSALSYAIQNEKIDFQPDDKRLLTERIEEIKRINREEHLPTRTVALSALIKLGEKLSSADLKFLQDQLTDVIPGKPHPIYGDKCSGLTAKFSESGGIAFWRTPDSELKLMKIQSKKGNFLTEEQLLFALRKWKKNFSNVKARTRILHIIKQSIKNGQMLQDQKLIGEVLNEALDDSEIKIKQDAIITLNYLAKNRIFPLEDNKKLYKAESTYRIYALKALILQVEKQPLSAEDSYEFIKVLSILQGDEELEHYSQYMQFLLKGNLHVLIKLLADEKHSTEASLALINISKKKTQIDDTIFRDLEKVLNNSYPIATKLNVIISLTNIIENHISIPESIIKIVANLIDEKKPPLVNASLVFLSHTAQKNLSIILSNELLDRLFTLLDKKSVALNASYFLANFIKYLPEKKFEDKISKILEKSSKLLVKQEYGFEARRNICLALINSSKIKLATENNIFINLDEAIKTNTDEEMLRKLLLIIDLMLENIDKNPFSRETISFLINGFHHQLEERRYISSQILCKHIKKISVSLDEKLVDDIAENLTRQESLQLTCDVFESIAESKNLPEKILVTISNLLGDWLPEVQIKSAKILYKISLIHILPISIFQSIELGLTNYSPEVIKYLLLALNSVSKIDQPLPDNIDKLSHCLVNIAENRMYKNYEINVNAVNVLLQFSSRRRRINLDLLSRLQVLISASNSELRLITAKMFKAQIDCLQLTIKDHNPDVINILNGMHRLLIDKNIVETALEILIGAQRYGYKIPEKVLRKISKFLFDQEKDTITTAASTIICEYDNKPLPKSLQWIAELEKNSKVLISDEYKIKEKNIALENFRKNVRDKKYLTRNCFKAIDQALKKEDFCLDVLLICSRTISNGQTIPQLIIENINNIILNQSCGFKREVVIRAIMVIAEIVVANGNFISNQIYLVIEKLFIDTKSSEFLLPLIAIMAKRGTQLSFGCIEKVINFITSINLDKCQIAANILNIIEKNFPPKLVSQLIENFDKIPDLSTRQSIGQLLARLYSRFGSIAVDCKESSLLKLLKNTDNWELENQLLKIIESHEHTLKKQEISELSGIKRCQHILFDQKNDVCKKISAIKDLISYNHHFEYQDIEALQWLTEQLYIKKKSSDIIGFILYYKEIKLQENVKFPSIIINILIDILSNNDDNPLRESAFEVLDHFTKEKFIDLGNHLFLSKMLKLEWVNHIVDTDKKRTIVDGWSNFCDEYFFLTLGNIIALCQFMNESDIDLQCKIIKLLLKEKERIPFKYHDSLLKKILNIFSQGSYTGSVEDIGNLFFYLFEKNTEDLDETNPVMVIEKQFRSNKITKFNLEMFSFLIKKFNGHVSFQGLKFLAIKFSGLEYSLKIALLSTFLDCVNTIEKMDNSVLIEIIQIANSLQYSKEDKEIQLDFSRQRMNIINSICRLLNSINIFYSDFFKKYAKEIEPFIIEHFKQRYPKDIILKGIIENHFISFMLICLSDNRQNIPMIYKTTRPEDYVQELLCNDLLTYYQNRTLSNFDDDKEIFNKSLDQLNLEQHSFDWDGVKIKFLWLLRLKQRREDLNLTDLSNLISIWNSYLKCKIKIYTEYRFIMNLSMTENIQLWMKEILSLKPKDRSLSNRIISLCKSSEWNVNILDKIFSLLTHSEEDIDNFAFCVDLTRKYRLNNHKFLLLIGNMETIAQLKKSLTFSLVSYIVQNINSLFIEHVNADYNSFILNRMINNLLNRGWSFQRLNNLLENLYYLKTKNSVGTDTIQYLIEALEIAYLYDINEMDFYDIESKKNLSLLSKQLYQHFLKQYFIENESERSLDELITEISLIGNNQNNEKLKLILNESKRFWRGSVRFLSDYKQSNECSKPIEKWIVDDIRKWSDHIRNIGYHENFLPEILAVIRRACFLHSHYEPRTVQLLAVLCLLYRTELKGRFAQIATGEGKSLILAILATIMGLSGKLVDVITSSAVLAKRDAENYKEFYHLFSLNVASNENDSGYLRGIKNCYKNDIQIVYGDASNFQFDILRHEYSNLGTRGTRGFEVVIIDEVDNLLIDENAKIAMLSRTIPGMNTLTLILTGIWHRLQLIINNKFNDEKLNYERLFEYVTTLNKGSMGELVDIPRHLEEFVEMQTPRWINSAILAHYEYKEGQHYTVECDSLNRSIIVPVDFTNTGVLQIGTSWDNGLQQFLQIKHGLQVSCESITTNFLSNVALIDRYNKNLFGITGTLGSEESQRLLDAIYSIDFVYIPTYKIKRFKELAAEFINSESDWLSRIVNSSMREARYGRVVLIICASIENVNKIFQRIKEQHSGKLYQYSKNDSLQEQFLESSVDSNTIIVATNLASRGTDIRMTRDAISNGGLHVCCTYLPKNQRVEDQIFGRASRKGEPGTAQLIINEKDTHKSKISRDNDEKRDIGNILTNRLPNIKFKDELFKKFMQLLRELEERDRDNQIYQSILTEWGLDDSFLTYLKEEMPKFNRLIVEEKWGLWLKKYDLESLEHNNIRINKNFEKFKNSILKEYGKINFINNPSYWINLGNNYLNKSRSWRHPLSSKYFLKLALLSYDKAISIDPIYAHVAYYNKACVLINIADRDYKTLATSALIEMKKIIEKILSRTHAMIFLIEKIQEFSQYYWDKFPKTKFIFQDDLSGQVLENIQILCVISESVQLAIEAIDKSQRFIQVMSKSLEGTKIYDKLDEKNFFPFIESTENQSSLITVALYGLIKYNDCGVRYPVLETMEEYENKTKQKSRLTIIFDSKELEINKNLKYTLKKLLPINRMLEEKQLTEPEDKKNISSNPERVIGNLERIQEISTFVWNIKEQVAAYANDKISNYITHPVKERWYGYDKAEQHLVTLELQGINLSNAQSFLEIELEKSSLNPDSKETLSFVIHNPKPEILSIIQCNVELNSIAKVQNLEFDNIKNITTISNGMKSNEIDKAPRNYDLNFSLIDMNCAVSILKLLIAKINESKNILLMLLQLDLILSEISQTKANRILDGISINSARISFKNLEKKDAALVIHLTDSQYDNAIFQFDNLNAQDAKSLVQYANRRDQHFKISTKPIEIELLKINPSLSLLPEYKSIGYDFLYSFSEKNPLPLRSLSVITIASILQIASGTALMFYTSGFGANIGMSLINEGIYDIVRAVNGGYTRNLDMMNYLSSKTQNITISLVTAGWPTSSVTAESAATQSIKLTDKVFAASTELGKKTSVRLASKVTATSIGKHVGRQTVQAIVKVSARAGLSWIGTKSALALQASIIEYARKLVEVDFSSGYFRGILYKIFAIDRFVYNNKYFHYENEMKLAARESVNEIIVAVPGTELLDMGSIDQFHERITVKISAFKNKLPQFNLILFKRLREIEQIDIDEKNANKVFEILKNNHIISEDGNILNQTLKKYLSQQHPGCDQYFVDYDIDHYNFDSLDLKEFNQHKKVILNACLIYHRVLSDDYSLKMKQFSEEISKVLAARFQSSILAVANLISSSAASVINRGVSAGIQKLEKDDDSIGNQTLVQEFPEQENKMHSIKYESINLDGAVQPESPVLETDFIDIANQYEEDIFEYSKRILLKKLHKISISSYPSSQIRGEFDNLNDSFEHPKSTLSDSWDSLQKDLSTLSNKKFRVHEKSDDWKDLLGHPKQISSDLFSGSKKYFPLKHKNSRIHEESDDWGDLLGRSKRTPSYSLDSLEEDPVLLLKKYQVHGRSDNLQDLLKHPRPTSSNLFARPRKSSSWVSKKSRVHKKSKFSKVQSDIAWPIEKKYFTNHNDLKDVKKSIPEKNITCDISILDVDLSDIVNKCSDAVEIIRVGCIEHFKMELEKYLIKTDLNISGKIEEILAHNWSVFSTLLIDKKKVMKFLIAILISEKNLSDIELHIREAFNRGKFIKEDKQRRSIQQIDSFSKKILDLLIESPAGDPNSIIKRNTGVDLDTSDTGRLLKKLIGDYFEINKERSMLQEMAGKINVPNLQGNLQNLLAEKIIAKDYSECGNLLRRGKYGEKAYIAASVIEKIGTILDGYFKTRELSIEARSKVQVAIAEIVKQTLSDQQKLFTKVVGVVESRAELLKDAIKSMDARLETAATMFVRVFEMKDPTSQQKMIGAIEKYLDTIKGVSSDIKGIAQVNGIDSSLIENCSKEMSKIILGSFQAFAILGKQDQDEGQALQKQLANTLKMITGSPSKELKYETPALSSDIRDRITEIPETTASLTTQATEVKKNSVSSTSSLSVEFQKKLAELYDEKNYQFKVTCRPTEKTIVIALTNFEDVIVNDMEKRAEEVGKNLNDLMLALQKIAKEAGIVKCQYRPNSKEYTLNLNGELGVLDQLAKLLQQSSLAVRQFSGTVPFGSLFYQNPTDTMPVDAKELSLSSCLIL